LDFSRLDASRIELEQVPFALRDTIESAVGLIAPTARTKGLSLSVTVAGDVPQRVVGDPGRLRQILFNLVGNAIKFTKRGSVRVEASCVEQSAAGIRIALSVTDTGISRRRRYQNCFRNSVRSMVRFRANSAAADWDWQSAGVW